MKVAARVINIVVSGIIAGVVAPVTGVGAIFVFVGCAGTGEALTQIALKDATDTTPKQ